MVRIVGMEFVFFMYALVDGANRPIEQDCFGEIS